MSSTLEAQILDILTKEFGLGQRSPKLLLVKSSGTAHAFVALSANPILVREAVIQHIGATTTDAVTVIVGSTGADVNGIILNPPTTSGFGGGALTVRNIDLSQIYFERAATSALTIAVLYFQ